MPEWYPLMQAARYLGVPPWDLADQAECWTDWALSARNAEGVTQPRQQPAAVPPAKPFRGLGG